MDAVYGLFRIVAGLIIFGFSLLVGFTILFWFDGDPGGLWIVIVLSGALGISVSFVNIGKSKKLLYAALDEHRLIISRNLRRATKINEYGAVYSDTRLEEIERFLRSTNTKPIGGLKNTLIVVENYLAKTNDTEKYISFDLDKIPVDGFDFEFWCKELIISLGCKAYVTSGSGDQGIDVIAEKDGQSIGIQCKRYSKPCGNKAVQEANAGKGYHDLDRVLVVATAGFTRSAFELGEKLQVELLDPRELQDFFAERHS